MRLIFAGTPEVALPSLNALVGSAHEDPAVVCTGLRADVEIDQRLRLFERGHGVVVEQIPTHLGIREMLEHERQIAGGDRP